MLHIVRVPAAEAKSVSDEPSWASGDVTDTNYQSQLRRGLNWHQYVASDRDLAKYLEEWIAEHYPNSTTKKDIARLRTYPANRLDRTMCALARLELKGFPLDADHRIQVENYLIGILSVKGKKKTVANKVKGPSVQDRMKKQVSGLFGDIDGMVDDLIAGKKIDKAPLIKKAQTMGLKAPHLQLIVTYISNQYTDEMKSASNKEDEQLVEGYAYMGPRRLKKVIAVLTELIAEIEHQTVKVKTQRIIRKKPQDKKKMASKIKFLAEFPDLNLKSLDPVDIIGATTLWVYDTKKRKLGYFEAEVPNGLHIRSTKVVGFKESCVKILRKPEEQLKHFKHLRKNQNKNWLMTGIRAKCGTSTGRTNDDLIILRID